MCILDLCMLPLSIALVDLCNDCETQQDRVSECVQHAIKLLVVDIHVLSNCTGSHIVVKLLCDRFSF